MEKEKLEKVEEMLTMEDVMENLHIKSKTTALKLFNLDGFPCTKIGKKYLVSASAYNKWIKAMSGKEIVL